jgi:hypothetical protein
VASKIRSDERLKELVVILLTSAGQSDEPVPGVDAELVKPVRPSQLFDVLHTLLAARSLRAEPPAAARELPPPDPSRQWLRVLVVEDNAANSKVTVRMVERLGYRADVASDGAAAVSILEHIQYDAVLMDCQMPEMDGYEATRQIRANENGGRRVPIIAMTAAALAGDRERCLAAGMDDYISKPVKLHIVAALLERWIAVASRET